MTAKTVAKNTALACRVMAHIEHLHAHPGPDRWDQSHFALADGCGTTACFAGWAVALADGPDRLDYHLIKRRACELLGIEFHYGIAGETEAGRIFFCMTDDPAVLRAGDWSQETIPDRFKTTAEIVPDLDHPPTKMLRGRFRAGTVNQGELRGRQRRRAASRHSGRRSW